MSLAYVFWHWRQAGVLRPDYERRQRAFHAALARAPSAGYSNSLSFRVVGADWAAGGAEAYEDWYLLESFEALGALNEAAVSAGRKPPHDEAAAVSAGGTAGLYRLLGGSLGSQPVRAYWFDRPPRASTAEVSARLAPLLDRDGAWLWMRQMVLGPAPEFCLHAKEPVRLPGPFDPHAIELGQIWPVAGDSPY